MSLDWTSTACEARSYLNANIIKMEGLIAFNISNILSRLKATKAILQLLTKLWSIKNINICLASGMWAGTGTKPNFTPKIYFTELGKFSCIQKPVRAADTRGTGQGAGGCWPHSRPFLSPFGAMVAPDFNFTQAPSILCLPTLLRTVSHFCLLILLHIEKIQKNPFFEHSGWLFS